MTTGEKIKAIRKEKGLTQKQLAAACGMYDSAIRRYESGRQIPKLSTLEKIAAALLVNVFDLCDIPAPVKAALATQSITNKQAKAISDAVNTVIEKIPSGLQGFSDSDTMKDRLLSNYESVNADGKQRIADYSDDIASNDKYKQ